MKLIEANQAKEFASTFLADKILQAAVNSVLDNVPGFEFVRCKDCEHGEVDDMDFPNQYYCHEGCGWNYGDFFCSFGERRTDG